MFGMKRRGKSSAMDTLISEGSVFEGQVSSEAGLRIEGRLVGDIECAGDVTVGEAGYAASNISARNVVIAGTVRGNVRAKGMITILASGRLEGNTDAQSLIIMQGACFQGSSMMAAHLDKPAEPVLLAEPMPAPPTAADATQAGEGANSHGPVAM